MCLCFVLLTQKYAQVLCKKISERGPCGGIGRRAGFKIQFWQQSESSSLSGGTIHGSTNGGIPVIFLRTIIYLL